MILMDILLLLLSIVPSRTIRAPFHKNDPVIRKRTYSIYREKKEHIYRSIVFVNKEFSYFFIILRK